MHNIRLPRPLFAAAILIVAGVLTLHVSAAEPAEPKEISPERDAAPATQPTDVPQYGVCVVNARTLFENSKAGERLKQLGRRLMQEHSQAAQGGDMERVNSLRQQMQRAQKAVFDELAEAVKYIGKERGCDVVFDSTGMMYQKQDLSILDLTSAAGEHWNATTTMPAETPPEPTATSPAPRVSPPLRIVPRTTAPAGGSNQ